MFKFLRRLFPSGAKSVAENDAKDWLNELRRNELSIGARRRIAPNEPIKAPAVGYGSAAAVAAPIHLPATKNDAAKPSRDCSEPEMAYSSVDGGDSVSDFTGCDTSASDSSSCDSGSD